MKVLFYACILALCLPSCYTSYSIQSAKPVPKGEMSTHAGAYILSPGFGVRYGLGNQQEISLKSSVINNELGYKKAFVNDDSFPVQIASGMNIGYGLVQIPTGEKEWETGVMFEDSVLVDVT